ncbi:hypothetical protein [Alkalinema sp. FACHB-956]|uniref:hypothetical protein n=1 Tax=Alkalinema sp. FACHB-956 TaxID=2692768 RepID=UPI001681E1C2|nr:hypothetical protein [Alkalinema sp. FACHB-956]MBD2328031.1 hypothetical protein [Alkalinema sp. FACHB-956]
MVQITRPRSNRASLQADFQYISEWDDAFLSLFPHRYDYIWAQLTVAGETVQWHTESRHPLSDRAIQQGGLLYGVRFGSTTNYILLDIDIGSPYHPRQDPLAIARILGALEPLGLISYLAVTSSYSQGLHLYLPFDEPQTSWKIALVVSTLLDNYGFKSYPGQLEIFPNPKPYVVEGEFSLFNAHRLPLQVGSYLLDSDFQPVSHAQSRFVEVWQQCQSRNALDPLVFKRVLKQAKQRIHRLSGKAEKFLNDLNAEIEVGWTGRGQTNRLLGRITLRTYIFHHVLTGQKPLTGQDLIIEVDRIARSLPGYEDWCQHQHELKQRIEEWARCIENSHYFQYGKQTIDPASSQDSNSDRIEKSENRKKAIREKIRRVVESLISQGLLPVGITDRFNLLVNYQIGGGSLYKHKDLWHPEHIQSNSTNLNYPKNSSSLLGQNLGNSFAGQAYADISRTEPDDRSGNAAEGLPSSVTATVTAAAHLQAPHPQSSHPQSSHPETLEPSMNYPWLQWAYPLMAIARSVSNRLIGRLGWQLLQQGTGWHPRITSPTADITPE